MPWYGEDNELKGVFGCAIMLDYFKPDNIADQLSLISNTFMAKILPSQNILPGKSIDGVYFSKREMEIIRLVIRGRTMREAAVILNLSRRTVENYFITIRNKMNVSSKSEFIDKVIDYFI
jgi:DNA-binding CsgD family transcriptional regulator